MNRNILNHSIENLTPTENKLLDYIEENIHRIGNNEYLSISR